MVAIALLVLWAASAQGEVKPIVPRVSGPGAPLLADVDLDEVPLGRALRLLAETYDVSIATGALPDTKVTVRLRGIGAQEAFAAVAAAAGLAVVREGSVVRLGPKSADAPARPIADRVYDLGVAPGEETLKTILPLLEPHLETATYNAVDNRIAVSALPATLARIDALLGELTRTPKQYEIEVQVVEVSKNALRQMGSQGTFGLDIRGGVLASTFPLAGLGDSHRYLPSPNELAALGRLGSGAPGSGESGSFGDPGFRFGQIDARGIGLLIRMLEQSGEARVMATPKVTALDNRKARISMVTTLRIPTFTQNQAFATTTVSGIEQVDVGTTLEVRPRHGAGRQILLTVSPEVSELQPNSSSVSQNGLTQGLPIVTRRRTETEVVLESGETLIIGGLVTEHKLETHGRTPGLASLPVIGRAFRLEGRQTDNTELLVFVTPRELPSPEERRSKVRVGEMWLPARLAASLESARSLLRSQAAADRTAGVRALDPIDADLLSAGFDASREAVALGGDPSLDVRVAAMAYLLRQRPADALRELERFKDNRAVALALLPVPMAPHLHAVLEELARPAGGAAGREPALAWSGTPAEIAVSGDAGDAAGIETARSALDLLARRAPDLRHLVGFGLATIATGAAGPAVDPEVRAATVTTAGMTPERVALQMVRLATLVFESRVEGASTTDGQALARAMLEETRALERFNGLPATTAPPAARDALEAGRRWIAANAAETTVGPGGRP
jgi:type II secretory pathway component GspD/PulD (secretin)